MQDHSSSYRSRRVFLKELGVLSISVPCFGVLGAIPMRSRPGSPVLVSVFLRGGADSLNMLVPHREPNYHASRRTLAIQPPGRPGGALALADGFGLHPVMKDLRPWFTNGRLAAVHAVGRADSTRSHFHEQDVWDTGLVENTVRSDGWINRHLGLVEPHGPVRALCLGDGLVRSMRGPVSVQAVSDLSEVALGGGSLGGARSRALLSAVYGDENSDLGQAGQAALKALDVLRGVYEKKAPPRKGARYPKGRFAKRMRQAAQLIKADVGLEVVCCDLQGWDTHDWQGRNTGQMPNLARMLAQTLHAFATDLGRDLDRVAVLVTSEFGRTLLENGTGGTDHGRAGVAWLLGGKVRGGRLHGTWPGLDASKLHKGRELQWTTDFRSLLTCVLSQHLKNPHAARVFPGSKPQTLELFLP